MVLLAQHLNVPKKKKKVASLFFHNTSSLHVVKGGIYDFMPAWDLQS